MNTNGYFITQRVLDEFREIGCDPLIKISFDGIGCHDWMRDRKGAEEKTLAAMEPCIKKGFKVMSQTQVHKKNLHTLIPTARKLNDTGVSILRLIRTTDAPRWHENAPDSCLSFEEYYTAMLDFMREYKESGMEMELMLWQFMKAIPRSKSYSLETVYKRILTD